uniref:Uncharacterized protein n=1 Tax=Rhizophora mucronata TaxID=61149 RepID=A0A2P2NZD4_RHIMU
MIYSCLFLAIGSTFSNFDSLHNLFHC